MRHRKAGRKLGRNASHRLALKRNLIRSLFQKDRIVTTREKAKEYAPFAEQLITLAKGKSLANYRRALSLLPDQGTVKKLFEEIGPRYFSRNGGYTRVVRLSKNRLGDNASQAILELIPEDEAAPEEKKSKKKGRAKKKAPAAKSKKTAKTGAADSKPEEDAGEASKEVPKAAKKKSRSPKKTEEGGAPEPSGEEPEQKA